MIVLKMARVWFSVKQEFYVGFSWLVDKRSMWAFCPLPWHCERKSDHRYASAFTVCVLMPC